MAISVIEGEKWDFLETSGVEMGRPAPAGEIRLPAVWRLFGPLDAQTSQSFMQSSGCYHVRSLVDIAIDKLPAVPKTLEVGGQTLAGRDVQLTDDGLDLSALFGGHASGQQAFLFGEIELPADTQIAIGGGCDFWMHWWIDGQPVMNTMDTGNIAHPIGPADHCFRCALKAGRHLLAIHLVSGMSSWVFKTKAVDADEAAEAMFKTHEPQQWAVSTQQREMRAPGGRRNWSYATAIRTAESFGDVTVECEYQLEVNNGNVGIVLGAQDGDHYYYAYVPSWGQLWRARACYAAIGIANGSGRIHNLAMQLMPNNPCLADMWRPLKVERRGDQIQMWVGGVKGPAVRDQTYGPGRIGVAGFGDFRVRNFEVAGQSADGGAWQPSAPRAEPWQNVEDDLSLGNVQNPRQLIRVGDRIVLPIQIGRNESCHFLNETNSNLYFYSSDDNGVTWQRYAGPMPFNCLAEGAWFVTQPGVIRSIAFDSENRRFNLRESSDLAVTWSDPVHGKLTGDWERDIFHTGCWNLTMGFTQLSDGTLLSVILHGYDGLCDQIPNHGQGTWGSEVAQPYCTLSHDKGLTWSEPVPMDFAAARLDMAPDGPCGGFSETSVAQLPDGRIVALARPFRAPYMWQTESTDGGRTWRQACYAPFSGAGGPQLVGTRSGYLISVKRGPGLGVHCSFDGGLNWDAGTMIDYTGSFNGQVLEVEPDTLLVSYPQSMDEARPSYARVQRITITPQGISTDA